MAVAPSLTTLSDTDEFVTLSETITYTDSSLTPPEVPIITSVTPDVADTGITISFVSNQLTISGQYTNVFTNKNFQYVPLNEPTNLVTVNYDSVPAEIDALIKYSPDALETKKITYTVVTSSGNATVEQTVTNSWDRGKDQMFDILGREA